MKDKIKAGIIGATGYAGVELIRILSSHSEAVISAVSSVSFEGQIISRIYPNLAKICDMKLVSADEVIAGSDVVFTALPHGLSEEIADKCISRGKVIIDLGADFRLNDGEIYKKWYGVDFAYPALHSSSVYSIPELHREKIGNKNIIANPGCYPTAAALGLYPALKNGLIETEKSNIIIDAKSGVTGAGRGLTQNTHYPEANEAFSAYKAGQHRHTPEIEQTLGEIAGEDIKITFVPHLLPVNRGIEETIYCHLKNGVEAGEVRLCYENAYKNEYFVRVLPEGGYADIKNVRASNFCDISLHSDSHTRTLIICSCIDNMVKGAAGQAVQNMNIRFSIEEKTALDFTPSIF